jgi:hypothetical protein
MAKTTTIGMSLFDEPLFGSRSKKDRKREQIRLNSRKGKAAENQVRTELQMEGYEVERTHEGADFRAKKRDLLTGEVVEEKKVEVKSGRASLSEKQKREKKKSDNYEVRRRDPLFF